MELGFLVFGGFSQVLGLLFMLGLGLKVLQSGWHSKSKDQVFEQVEEEDDEFDVLALRRLVKVQRQRADAALVELDKERVSAASAADEAMAMILRLHKDKSLVEIEANQYRRLAQQKQQYDQQVIHSLRSIITNHFTHLEGDDSDSDFDHVLYSSLDYDASLL